MQAKAIRIWSFVHTWTSIISTAFMLLLCVTGLLLIFYEEIDGFLHETVPAAKVAPGTPAVDLDQVITNGMGKAPGEYLQFLIWDRDDPNVIWLSVAKAQDAPSEHNRAMRMDAHTAKYLDAPPPDGHLTYYLFKLHVDLFAGLPGKLFLGFMGLLLVVAIISGSQVIAVPAE